MDNDRTESLRRTHKAAMSAIQEMVAPLMDPEADEDAQEDAHESIMGDPLSLEFRDGWRLPGAESDGPEEYCFLLTTGGPAVRIVGRIDAFGTAESWQLQVQDWFVPWTSFPVTQEEHDALRVYVEQFYLGEG